LAVIRSTRFAFTALAAAALCASALAVAPAQVRPQGDAANGKQIYLRDACFTCHGFRELLRDPPGDMPAYSEAVLSDKDIADIYAFVESLPGPRSPKDIRVLDN
jgi:mono/diheme cytochrome c family protein